MESVLISKSDRYGGVLIDADKLPSELDVFERALKNSLLTWNTEGKRGIWLTVPVGKSAFVAVASTYGFQIHHASHAEGIVMTAWLPKDVASPLPLFCHHFIGVGGFVLNKEGKLLVVRERYSVLESKPYKLPGGLVDPSENLTEAVVREVFEETGVRAEFRSIICFRHAHKVSFGKSDLYFICKLAADDDQINIDPKEIEECRWITPDEYLVDPTVTAFNKRICKLAMKGTEGGEFQVFNVLNYNNTVEQQCFHAPVLLD